MPARRRNALRVFVDIFVVERFSSREPVCTALEDELASNRVAGFCRSPV
jgi:hypothetical protein